MNTEMTRVDMHVHCSASELSRLDVQRSLAPPECATAPTEVYEQAKRRGMDFVTITDHDTIAGVLTIAQRPDVFISEELTVWFKNEPQAVHVLCYGITPEHHAWLQAHNDDVETCAVYLSEHNITAALAHPFYAVRAPLTPRHRRRLAELFPIWETRNGSRAKELNLPAFVYIETHGGTAIGGSDDHAGIDIGRTFTEAPPARTPEEFLAHVRAGRVVARGEQGSAAKWTHTAIALAIRSLTLVRGQHAPDPATALKIVRRVLGEGNAREGEAASDLGPEDARALLGAWLVALELEPEELLARLQNRELTHPDLLRRARLTHERQLADAVAPLARTRLSAVTEVETPYYPGLKLGVPSLLAMVEAIAEGRYDLVQVCTPGPAGVLAWLTAQALGIPLIASHHSELGRMPSCAPQTRTWGYS